MEGNESFSFEDIIKGIASEDIDFDSVMQEELSSAFSNVRAAFKELSIAAGGVYQDALDAGVPADLAHYMAMVVVNTSVTGGTD